MGHKTPTADAADHASLAQPLQPLVLRVALRPIRLLALTVLAIGAISGVVLFLHHGLVVKRFTRAARIPGQDDKLVDTYNSYAGNIMSAFGRPIEFFVTASVQVLVLRFLASYVLQAEPDNRVVLLTLALTTGFEYLLNNGFNALNVQVRDDGVRSLIRATDLSFEWNATAQQYDTWSTSVSNSVSELSDRNPTANTVLRNLVRPRKTTPLPKCDWSNTQADFKTFVQDDVLEFGMPQRDWMELMVLQAVASKSFRMVLNATDADANKDVSAAKLPMNASVAANLFVHSLFLSSQYLPWGKKKEWEGTPPNPPVAQDRNVSTARLMGVLPPDVSANEQTQREWLVREAGPLINKLFQGGTVGLSTSDITMEFTHTELSPLVAMDALTFEVATDPSLYTTSIDAKNQSRYLKLDPYQCNPWPGRCLIEKRLQPPLAGLSSPLLYDAPMQVHAFAMCLDENGTEALQSQPSGNRDFDVRECTQTATNSLLLVSAAKRLVADALVEKASLNTSDAVESPVATNVRKIYSFTVARLGWTLQNFTQAFGAKCEGGIDCLGLSFPLIDDMHELVVGAHALPVDLVTHPYFGGAKQRPLPLVQIAEPPRDLEQNRTDGSFSQYNAVTGDILMPHNIKKLWWTTERTAQGTGCSAVQEDRVRRVLDNHMYMESTLQATYTAGLYFLFQNSVKREVLETDPVTRVETLAFDGNVYVQTLWASTPLQNTVLTLAGCVLLAVGLLAAWIWSMYGRITKRPDPLATITSPHVIARAMLDESQFPALLLHRRIVDTRDGCEQRTVAAYEIQSLLLQHQKDSDDRIAATIDSMA